MSVAAGIGHNRRSGRSRVYAITFDFDAGMLEQLYPSPSWKNACSDVRRSFEQNGFENKQGSVYFALDEIDAVECVGLVQDLAETYDWFTPSLEDIRMLRIEENNDLMPILDRKRRRKRP